MSGTRGVSEPVNSIFQRSWWLDAVAPGQWEAAEVHDKGQLKARMPYVVSRKLGMTCLKMPPLTQTLGPWLDVSAERSVTRLAQEHSLLQQLAEQLPAFDYFHNSWHHSVRNWLPFHWRGFECSTRYTYVIDDLSDLDQVQKNMTSNRRSGIRNAAKTLAVRTDLGLGRFIELIEMTYGRQNRKPPVPIPVLERLDAACLAQDARKIFFVEDAAGNLYGAAYLVWDEHSAYYLMSGTHNENRHRNAIGLAIWEAIQHASTVSRAFDFEGSMVQRIETFVREFGGEQRSYFAVKGHSRRMRVAELAQRLVRRAAG